MIVLFTATVGREIPYLNRLLTFVVARYTEPGSPNEEIETRKGEHIH